MARNKPRDLTELRCSNCGEFIGALGQVHAKKPFCYDCAHKLGYWKPLPSYDTIRIIQGKTVTDPARGKKNPTRRARIGKGGNKTQVTISELGG